MSAFGKQPPRASKQQQQQDQQLLPLLPVITIAKMTTFRANGNNNYGTEGGK